LDRVSAIDAVLLDSFGTLVVMEPPARRLRAELAARGVEVDDERARAAFAAEIAYYVEHHVEGRDAASLDDLRTRCARVLRDALGVDDVDLGTVRESLLAAIRFEAQPDAAPALRALRQRGLRLVVVSNWDCSLPEVLRAAGLGGLVDAVVTSAEAGAVKPDRRLFEAALAAGGAAPEDALHVGDSVDGDVMGARAAGIRAVFLRRSDDAPPPPPDVPEIASLEELLSLI
jgi:putative hydrolase of the HAD superfamily